MTEDIARLPESYIAKWLREHSITMDQIERGQKVWPTAEGMVPITLPDIERLISIDDPVAWARLNLTERRDLVVDGVKVVTAGHPWTLFPIQAKLVRTHGDLVVECGSEVGKTRDIVLRSLWKSDTASGPGELLIGGDSDGTLEEVWEEIKFQIEANARIAGGLKERLDEKPNRRIKFANNVVIQMRICGHDGQQFRGVHATIGIYGDEVAKWKNPKQLDEFWRGGMPGSEARIYSTPDGDYSSPFFALCDRAVPVDTSAAISASGSSDERHFRKFHISKKDLPAPFWSEKRAEHFRKMYGGEHTPGWITNVLGQWGSPAYSIFPMDRPEPCLKATPEYRIVTVRLDRESRQISLAAARLSEQEGAREIILADERLPLLDGDTSVASHIATFFPPVVDWISPRLFCGGDLGSAQDPSEFIFARDLAGVWTDVFRLHLAFIEWPLQAAILARLDHASGHQVVFSIDNGSAGNALLSMITTLAEFVTCRACGKYSGLPDRIVGRGMGNKVPALDMTTGEPIPNPDKFDSGGNPVPLTLSNKEYGTRCLERKMNARELAIANDGGAGDQRLAAAQLLINHTAAGVTALGERRFRGEDDHHVEARRQLALAIVGELRGDDLVQVTSENMRSAGSRKTAFGDAPLRSSLDGFASPFRIGEGW